MSITFDGINQRATGGRAPPKPGLSFVLWVKRVTDIGAANEALVKHCRSAATQINAGVDYLNANGLWRGTHTGSDTGNSSATLGTDTWYGFWGRYQGESNPGVSADGVLTISYLTSVSGGFIETLQATGCIDQDPLDYVLGNSRPDGAGTYTNTRYAIYKIWSAHDALDAAAALTELSYRNPQVAAWASHAFRTGALNADDSGNARTLTLTNTPTFDADEPADILGDDPVSASSVVVTRFHDIQP